MRLIRILEVLLELIYPNVCGFCEEINRDSLCEMCKEKIQNICLARIDKYENINLKYFDEHGYIFKYEGSIRKMILNFKFNDKAYLYKTFAKIIISNKNIYEFIHGYDLIIPVPIHKKRYSNRGYNQSELLSREIVNNFKNIKFSKEILVKTKNNIAQSTLNKMERKLNVKGAYEVRNNFILKDKKVLLIDDIYTTGNTANECARMLKKSGVRKIGVLTIAKD